MNTELQGFDLKSVEDFAKKGTEKYHFLVNFIDELLEDRYQKGKADMKKAAKESFANLIDGNYLEKGTILH